MPLARSVAFFKVNVSITSMSDASTSMTARPPAAAALSPFGWLAPVPVLKVSLLVYWITTPSRLSPASVRLSLPRR